MGRLTDIDYDKLIQTLLPVRLRKPKMIAWLSSLCFPLTNYLYSKFKTFESKSWYDIKYQSGSVAHLEFVLSDLMGYNPEERLIRIEDGDFAERLYLPRRAQEKAIRLGVVYVKRRAVYLGGTHDFRIIVHSSLIDSFNEELCRAIADRYKRDSKKYIILYETF